MNLIKNHIAALLERSDRTAKQDNLAVEPEDFEYAPFVQKRKFPWERQAPAWHKKQKNAEVGLGVPGKCIKA